MEKSKWNSLVARFRTLDSQMQERYEITMCISNLFKYYIGFSFCYTDEL